MRHLFIYRNVSKLIEYAHHDTRMHYDVMQLQRKQRKSTPAKNFDRVGLNQLRKKNRSQLTSHNTVDIFRMNYRNISLIFFQALEFFFYIPLALCFFWSQNDLPISCLWFFFYSCQVDRWRCPPRVSHDEIFEQMLKLNETHLVFYGHRCFVASSGFRSSLHVRYYRLVNAAAMDPSFLVSFFFFVLRCSLWLLLECVWFQHAAPTRISTKRNLGFFTPHRT